MRKFLFVVLAMAIAAPALFPQDKNTSWKDRVRSERIAFITEELSLTPAEAEKFWPVYNQYMKQKGQAQGAVRETFRALDKAVTSGGNVEKCLDAYIKALDATAGKEAEALKAYEKVLPVEKIAKLYLAEEKFRMEQIHRLHHWQKDKGPQDNGRPAAK